MTLVSRGRVTAAFTLALLIGLVPEAVVAQSDVFATGVVTGDFLYNTEEDASVADARFELDIGVGLVTVGGVFRAYQLSDPSYNPKAIYKLPGTGDNLSITTEGIVTLRRRQGLLNTLDTLPGAIDATGMMSAIDSRLGSRCVTRTWHWKSSPVSAPRKTSTGTPFPP